MELPKELLDGVEALVRQFGLSQFHEAVTAVSFSPTASKANDGSYGYSLSTAATFGNIFDIQCNSAAMVATKLALLGSASNIKQSENIVLRIRSSLSDRETRTIIQAMDSHNKLRLKWGNSTGLCRIHIQGVGVGWSLLEPPFAVKIHEPSLISLQFNSSYLTSYHCAQLQRMLDSNSLHELVLDQVTFSDDSTCLHHIITGLEDAHGLKTLRLEGLEVLRSRPSDQRRVLRALSGLPCLKYLKMDLTCNTSEIPNTVAKNMLLHSDCNIETLDLKWIKRTREDESGEDEEDEDEIGARFDSFCSAFQQNSSVRVIDFDFIYDTSHPDQLIKKLFQMAFSPRKQWWRLEIAESTDSRENLEIYELSKFVEPDEPFDPNEAHQCKVYRFQFARNSWNLFAAQVNENIKEENIRCLLHLVKHRLPYLRDVGLDYDEWEDDKSLISNPEFVRMWDEVWICLEQNRVGMALLHPSVSESVPPGLWPTVFARTTVNMTDPSDEDNWDREENPLDGLFAVVRRLLLSGHCNNKNYTVEALATNGENKGARLN